MRSVARIYWGGLLEGEEDWAGSLRRLRSIDVGITAWSPDNSVGRLIVTEGGPARGLDSAAIHALAASFWS